MPIKKEHAESFDAVVKDRRANEKLLDLLETAYEPNDCTYESEPDKD